MLDDDGHFIDETHRVRRGERFKMEPPEQIDYMDVSPKQIVSSRDVAHPVPRARRRQPRADGLEHAAPGGAAAAPGAPLVGTGMERAGRRDSGQVIVRSMATAT